MAKKALIFAKSEAYAKLTVILWLFYDYLLIIQMLKFKQKTRYETPRLPQIASTTSVLRKYYDGITVLN